MKLDVAKKVFSARGLLPSLPMTLKLKAGLEFAGGILGKIETVNMIRIGLCIIL